MYRDRIRLDGRGVRLLGLGVNGLEPKKSIQGALFTDPDQRRARRIARATDAVRNKMGERSLTRARLLRKRSDDEPDEASSLPAVD